MHVPHTASRAAIVLDEAIQQLPGPSRARVDAASELDATEAQAILAGMEGAEPEVRQFVGHLLSAWSNLSATERTAALLAMAEILARTATSVTERGAGSTTRLD